MGYSFATPAQLANLKKLQDELTAATERLAQRDAIKIKYGFDLSQIVASPYVELLENEARWSDPHPDSEAVERYVNEGGKLYSPYTTNPVIAAWQILKAQNSIWSSISNTSGGTQYQALKANPAATRGNIETISKKIDLEALEAKTEANENLLAFEKLLDAQEDTKEDAAVTQAIKNNIATITKSPEKIAIALGVLIVFIALTIYLIKKSKTA